MEEKRKARSDPEGLIEGRNAVTEALRAGTAVDKVWLARGEESGPLRRIAALARSAGAVVVEADRRKLDAMSVTGAHQGVIAMTAAQKYAEVPDLLRAAEERGEAPLLVVCDEISDPHNLGAIIRSAECAGAHGVIIPKRRSAGLTAVVAKASAGALAYLPVARVPNIPALLKDLKKRGLWIYGADASGTASLYETDWTGPAALVIGAEGSGMTRLAAEQCDFLVRIPMKGSINSLNASTACAVLLYEAVRQRDGHHRTSG
ncbi:MAG: 23S rRNA (guanosine(2251)-2'-O)-methyltransferase RlmB [Oscillibacter sp.]|nr:23S rRNA (guanosine(2251)-2'-O)-methyltransferase RlmB [Oscillibacter sp.]